MLCMSVNLQHNMLLLVYQHVLLEVNQQHVVVGIYYNLHLQHLHIKEFPGFPFLDAWFPPKHNIIILLITCCMQSDSIYNG